LLKQLILLTAVLSVSACSSLPRSGPSDKRIVAAASASLTMADKGTTLQYALVDLTPSVLSLVPDYDYGSLNASFGVRGSSPAALKIGVGDQVQITIFESQSGGLFVPEGGGGSSGNYVTLPTQAVAGSGVINVPFAGTIRAEGLTVSELEEAIRIQLVSKAIEPQVVIALTRRASSEVTVLGDVGSSQKISLGDAGERVLDAIAKAGGLHSAPYDSTVSVTRNGRKATIYFSALTQNADENIFLQPGDLVFVESEERTFTAFGSTGLTGEFPFDAEDITLDRAVAKAGGLLDGRADPRQVFLYREETRSVLQSMGVDLSAFPISQSFVPTIYRTNFADPAGFFLARDFPMRKGDLIYISNADAVEVTKAVNVFNGVTSTLSTSVGVARNTRDFVEGF
jgi:polysaccharide biosynthesis/export protein